MPSHTAFASTYLNAEGDIPGLLEMLWNETRNPVGRTLQIDFRNKDFAKAIPYYSFHISKTQFPTSENSRALQHTLAWKMFESTMLKGYNCNFRSFDALRVEIERESNKTYGRNCFKLQHLHLLSPVDGGLLRGPDHRPGKEHAAGKSSMGQTELRARLQCVSEADRILCRY